MHFKLCHHRDRKLTSNKRNFENKLFIWFYASENQNYSKIQTGNKTREDKNLKISFMKVMQNLFSFQTLFEPMDGFQIFMRCLEPEKILHNLYKIDFEIFGSPF